MWQDNAPADPLARARSVDRPAITEVLDRDSGQHIQVTDWIAGNLYQALIGARVALVERMEAGDPRFLCRDCNVPVYLVSRPEERKFFFRHRHEDGSCPAQTRSPLTAEEITARKYHGLRESKPHRAIKALIARSLAADPAFADIAAETTWRSASHPDRYRRPDVQARRAERRLAFEVQLSTTFLSVVAGRRAFYRQEGALLVWIFGSFDPAYRRLTTDDLLFSNNSNIFIVDEATAALSEKSGQFHLRCFHRAPFIEQGRVADRWVEAVVPFVDLVQDQEGQRLYLFDYAGEEQTLHDALQSVADEREAHLAWIDQQDLFEFWQVHGYQFVHRPEHRQTWTALRARFARRDIDLPSWPDSDGELRAMLNALYSVQQGVPVGWKFSKLIEVAHCLAENHPKLLVAFGFALKIHEREKMLAGQDQKGKWEARMTALRPAIKARDPQIMPDQALLPLMTFLFPQLAAKVQIYVRRMVGDVIG